MRGRITAFRCAGLRPALLRPASPRPAVLRPTVLRPIVTGLALAGVLAGAPPLAGRAIAQTAPSNRVGGADGPSFSLPGSQPAPAAGGAAAQAQPVVPADGGAVVPAPAGSAPSPTPGAAVPPPDLQFLPLRTDIDPSVPPVQLLPGLPPGIGAPTEAPSAAPAVAPRAPVPAPAAGAGSTNIPSDLQFLPRSDVDPRAPAQPGSVPEAGAAAAGAEVPAAAPSPRPGAAVPPADLQFLPRADVDPRAPNVPAAGAPDAGASRSPAAGAASPPADLQFLPRGDVTPPAAARPADAGGAGGNLGGRTENSTGRALLQPPPEAPPPAPAAAQSSAGSEAASKPPAKPADPRNDTGPIVKPPVQSGDVWVYRRSNGRASGVMRQTVQRVSEDGIALRTENSGSPDSSTALYNRDWALVASGYNDYQPALAYYSFPMYVGKRWSINSAISNFGAGQTGRVRGEAWAAGWERVEVAAGSFMAMRIEIDMETADPGNPERAVRVRETHWYARTVLRAVKVESHSVVGDEAPTTEQIELISFRMD